MSVIINNGATVNGVTVDTEVIMKRTGYDKWPTLTDGLSQWEQLVKQQAPRDFKSVDFKSLKVASDTGGLYVNGKNAAVAMPATKTALGHLVSYLPEDRPSNLLNNLVALPPAIRAQAWDYYTAKADAKTITLRTAVGASLRPTVRAAVSTKHSHETGDDLQLIANVRDTLSTIPQARLRVIRRWDSTFAEIVIPNVGIQPKVGVTIMAKLTLWNSETKGSALNVEGGSYNLVCLNGATRMVDGSTFGIRHVGDIAFKGRQSIRVAIEGIAEHLQQLKTAYSLPLPMTRAQAIEQLTEKFKLPETTGTALATLWDVDGDRSAGDTLAGLVNAVTRHAQTQSVEDGAESERIAGDLLNRQFAALD